MKTAIYTIGLSLSASLLYAQAGSLDGNFDGDGKTTLRIDGQSCFARGVAMQPNGYIVVGAIASNGADEDFGAARYLPDGTLDPTFSFDGQVATDMDGSSTDVPVGLLLQPDGKILVGGYVSSAAGLRFALARYLADGALDASFDGDGKAFADFGDVGEMAYCLALQPDGKILVGGTKTDGTQRDFAIARFNTDGSLDASFSFDGKVTTDFNGDDDVALSLFVQSDGKILASGLATDASKELGVVRYLPDGTLDNSFGTLGKVVVPFTTNDEVFFAMTYWNERIILGGFTDDSGNNDFAVARLLSNGSLDPSFSFDGKLTTSISAGGIDADDWAMALLVQPDGKILLGGYSDVLGQNDFALVRYNWDGSLDLDFGSNGKVYTDLGGADDDLQALALQADGKLVAAGRSEMGMSDVRVSVARYLTDLNMGVLDFALAQPLAVYPNPIRQQALLEYMLAQPETLSLRLVNAQGQVVQTFFESQPQSTGAQQYTIAPDANLPRGIYFLQVSNENGQRSIQLILE